MITKSRLAALLASAAFGSAVAVALSYGIHRGEGAADAASLPSAASSSPRGGGEDAAVPSDPGTLTSRIARHRAISGLTAVEDVESRIAIAAAAPRSFDRDTEIEALFARLFEINPRRAAGFVASIKLPESLRAGVFRAWAEIDMALAAETLALLEPADEMLLALGILDVADYGEDWFARLVAQGRSLDFAGLEVAALVQESKHDPVQAVAAARQLDGYGAREIANEEIARASVSVDPLAALAASELPTDVFLRHEYQVALFKEWASTEPSSFLAYLATVDPNDDWTNNVAGEWGALDIAATAAPTLVLRSAERLGGRLGAQARAAGLAALAEQDPVAALTYFDSLAAEQRSSALLAAVAAGYARSDADAAAAWVTSLRPPNGSAVDAVITELASVDLGRALELELATRVAVAPPVWLMVPNRSDLDYPAQIADRIVAAGYAGRGELLLEEVMKRWAGSDPYGALSWVQTQADSKPSLMSILAERLGSSDLNRALDLASLVAPEHREQWITRAVVGKARNDLAGALDALERFRSDPLYGPTLSAVLRASATGPRVKAALVAGAPLSALAEMAYPIATDWARSDAHAAAAWAAALPDTTLRTATVRAVLQDWVRRDASAASTWARSLSDAALRADALAFICREAPGAPHCA